MLPSENKDADDRSCLLCFKFATEFPIGKYSTLLSFKGKTLSNELFKLWGVHRREYFILFSRNWNRKCWLLALCCNYYHSFIISRFAMYYFIVFSSRLLNPSPEIQEKLTYVHNNTSSFQFLSIILVDPPFIKPLSL